MPVSIKEKAEEIKGEAGSAPETFFLLDSPQKPALPGGFPTKVSALIAAVLVATAIGSYSLGNYAGKSSVVTERITPTTGEVQLSRAVLGASGNETRNESIAASSTRVEGTGSLQAAAAAMAGQGSYVGSRKGTKYHLPWCPGARTISEENKVWFESKADAESKGYTPAANCKGL